MNIFLEKIKLDLLNVNFSFIAKIGITIGLMCFSSHAMAAMTDGDLLQGTTSAALATMNGSGRYWAYIIDFAISLGAFAKTKNPFVFFSVLAVALGITVVYKMAGGS